MTVLVAGPRQAGVSGLVVALRAAMPGRVVSAEGELESGELPAAVVFVVSAAAPATGSDCDLIDSACGYADLVVGVVSKIDAHRPWREVMATNRALLAERSKRYLDVPWTGVAAAPEFGEPRVDELVAILTQGLAEPDLARRNRLRVNDIGMRALRDRRREIVRGRRTSTGTGSGRAAVQEARVRLVFLVRKRCAGLSAELRQSVGVVPRGGVVRFEERVHEAARDFVGEVDAEIARELDAVATRLALLPPGTEDSPCPPPINSPQLRADRLQSRLTAVLGAGFGMGVALAASRLLVGALPGFGAVGWIGGGLLGLVASVWVIGARGLLNRRAVLERWVGEVAGALRACGEEMVTSRLLASEVAFAAQLAASDELHAARTEERLGAIDAELHRLSGKQIVRTLRF